MAKKMIGIIMGIACVIIGVFIMVSYFHAQKTQTAETTAMIIRIDSEVETDTDGFDTRWYYPVVEYAVDDKKYEERLPDSGSTDSTEYKEGESVIIQYNPDNPQEFSRKDSKGGIIGGIFFIIFGMVWSQWLHLLLEKFKVSYTILWRIF